MLKKSVLFLMSVSIAMLLVVGCCVPKAMESLPVTLHPQETNMWCWAASGQMVMDYLGHDVSQCVQANNRFGLTSCCNTPTPGACVNGGWPEFAKYNFDSQHTTNTALTWKQLTKEISTSTDCSKRPVCFTWHWNGGGGHMMVAIGYKTVDGVNMVEVNNPLAPNVGSHYFIAYNAYVSGSGYSHWDDYYRIYYKGGK